ncbi:MAG: DsbA family protein [Pyrinomonadaceae bacterium]
MHEHLFKHQQELEEPHLLKYAAKVGLDAARFEREMGEHLYAERVKDDFHHALYGGGVTGTPTLYVNNVRHDDSVNLEGMLVAVERALR